MEQEQTGHPGLEIDENLKQERAEWILQRIAWTLCTVLMAGIFFGLLGRGPLSEAQLRSEDGAIRVEYDRFLRNHSPDSMKITIETPSDTVRLSLGSEFTENVQIESILPPPREAIGGEGMITYIFNTQPKARMQATIYFTPQKTGRMEGWVAADAKPRLVFSQFVYP